MTKNKRSDYINRVRAGIVFMQLLEAMEDNGELRFEYGTGTYEIHASIYDSGMRSYSIGEADALFGNRMNISIEQSSKVYLYLYTYDLFSTKTSAKLYFEHIKIVEKPEDK